MSIWNVLAKSILCDRFKKKSYYFSEKQWKLLNGSWIAFFFRKNTNNISRYGSVEKNYKKYKNDELNNRTVFWCVRKEMLWQKNSTLFGKTDVAHANKNVSVYDEQKNGRLNSDSQSVSAAGSVFKLCDEKREPSQSFRIVISPGWRHFRRVPLIRCPYI